MKHVPDPQVLGSQGAHRDQSWPGQGIGKTGVNIVRVGRPEAIREDVKAYALDGRWKDRVWVQGTLHSNP